MECAHSRGSSRRGKVKFMARGGGSDKLLNEIELLVPTCSLLTCNESFVILVVRCKNKSTFNWK